MISEKKQLFFLPIILLIFAVVLGVGWIHTLIMVGATTLGATIGFNGQIGLWGGFCKSEVHRVKSFNCLLGRPNRISLDP